MDTYVYAITALLPLVASMVIFQVNPYHALVIRGILGAVAALVYTVLGAADVALTEALVGTLLAIALYAVAVRSSLVLRLGVLKDEAIGSTQAIDFEQLMANLRAIFGKRHMRVELIPYLDREDLQQALVNKDVHAICIQSDPEQPRVYHATTRLRRLYDILQAELVPLSIRLTYLSPADIQEVQP